VRNGVKLRQPISRAQIDSVDPTSRTAAQTLSARWLSVLESAIDPQFLNEGLEYAQAGQIVDLDIKPGRIDAHVQGRAPRPYHTVIHTTVLSAQQWERLEEGMIAEAAYVAKLLVGELPAAFDQLLCTIVSADWLRMATWSAGNVAPADSAPLSSCTCGEPHPCKHVAAVGYIVAERLLQQPALILTMLGKPADVVLDHLRQKRTIQTRGMASAHVDALSPQSQVQAPPLQACIEDFWRNPPGSSDPADLENQAPLKHVPHALLRRLGPSTLSGRFPMVGLLASVYDTVSTEAAKLRDAATLPDDSQSQPE
jgi:uncharacterized Zn finger protein